MKENINCVSCGEILHGKYCHKCGEKILDKKEFTVIKFLEQSVYAFTHLESKIIRSLIVLLTKPGLMTKDYLAGKKTVYAKPVQIFVIANIVYFFVLNYVGYDIFTSTLDEYMDNTFTGKFISSLVIEKIKTDNIDLNFYKEKFYDGIYLKSKVFIVLMIPLVALLMKLLYLKSNRLFYEHLVFSTHYMTFLLLFITVILNIVSYVIYFVLHFVFKYNGEYILSNEFGEIIILLYFIFYTYLSLKRVYLQNRQVSFLKTIFFVFGFFVAAEVYRYILFFIVYYFS